MNNDPMVSELASQPAHESAYRLVINDEDQYSIWPVIKQLPIGWRDAGYSGTKQACLEQVDQLRTNILPKSVAARGFQVGYTP